MLHNININILTGSISAKDKHPCLIVYTKKSHARPPSVTSVLRMSVQPAKPASSIGLFCEHLTKVYVFSADKILTTLCATLPNRISHFKVLATP